MLKNEIILMSSDDDAPIMAFLSTGYNYLDELVICVETHDDGSIHEEGTSYRATRQITATLDKDHMRMMTKSLRIGVYDLQGFLNRRFQYRGYVSHKGRVFKQFQRMLDFVLDCGSKYKLHELDGIRCVA